MKLYNIDFDFHTKDDLFADGFLFLLTVNAEIIELYNTNEQFRSSVVDAKKCFDGVIPLIFARVFKGCDHEKISGSEVIFDILEDCSEKNKSIFFLGGSQQANKKALERISLKYNIKVDGFSPPFEPYPFTHLTSETIKSRINKFNPDYLIICFDALKSNLWINDNLGNIKELNINFVSGFGGVINLLSGDIRACPAFIKLLGLESLFRLVVEPRFFRLKRIYTSLKGIRYLWIK